MTSNISTALTRFAFIATDLTTHQIFAFHRFQSRLGFFLIWHFYKTKTTTPSGFAVMDDFGALDFSMSFEEKYTYIL
jgi:hypothetical protein